MSAVSRERAQPDRWLLFTTVLLCAGGLVMVTSASVAFAYTQHQSAWYYAERQGVWMLIGFAALFALGRFDYRRLRPLAPAGAVVAILLMLLVLALAALYEGPYLPDSQPRDEVRPGLRSLHVARKGRRSRHFILYPTRDAERIEVVRILHDSMDIVAISHPESTGGVRSPRASFL